MGVRGVGSPAALRLANRQRVLEVLRLTGSASQSELARRSGLSRATVSNIVADLRNADWVSVSGTEGGRRGSRVSLNLRAGLVIGLDFGHRHLRVAVADLAHTVHAEECRDLPCDHGVDDDVPLAAELVDKLLAQTGTDRSAVIGVGMGLPGPVDHSTGEIRSPAILPGWAAVRSAEVMSDRLGLPVLVDNDANLGALGELMWGAGAGARHLIYVKASTGIGAGLVLDGQLHRGSGGSAGEIGHVTVEDAGALCHCGDRGCLETVAGAEALLALLRTTHGPDLTVTDVIARALDGDGGCRRILADAGRAMGIALANLCNVLSPDRVVVGGALAGAGSVLLGPLRDMVRRHALPAVADGAAIRAGVLGERAEVLGAVALVLHETDPLALRGRAPPVPVR